MATLGREQSGWHLCHSGWALLILWGSVCSPKHEPIVLPPPPITDSQQVSRQKTIDPVRVEVPRAITINTYFDFMDSLVLRHAIDTAYGLGEYLLVHANPWILDSLRATDYYTLKSKGIYQPDQRTSVILQKGAHLIIPDTSVRRQIRERLQTTTVDVNIPEFTLRLIQLGDTILRCRVRVGRFAVEFLPVVGHDVNLQTPIGRGEIVRIERNPLFINPDNGIPTRRTKRDDGRYTAMPRIPCLEPAINGIRHGSLIHATTNIQTLGMAYSHGCIGTSEPDAWMIYYNAPLGTRVLFRYDLKIRDQTGKMVALRDIYKKRRRE